jgi:cytochrome c-type biogenesis protein CcmF
MLLFAFGAREGLALVALGIIGFTGAATLREFGVAALARRRMTGEAVFRALGRVVRREHRRFGGYTIHLGITVMAVAIVGSTVFQTEERISLVPGETARVGRYNLTYRGLFSAPPDGNGVEERRLAPLSVSAGGHALGELTPERRFFRNYQEPSTKIPIRSTPLDDLYVVLQAFGEGGSAIFVVFVNPLVFWLWIGGLVALGGAWMTLWPNPVPRRAGAAAPVRVVAAGDV